MSNKRAFTLVEMLVVVVIISILAAIITAAVAGAFRSGKRARIAIEMNQIVMALESYKNEFGEYPPDGCDVQDVVRHIKKRYPRYVIGTAVNDAADLETLLEPITDQYISCLQTTHPELSVTQIDVQASFWVIALGGFPNSDGTLSGFNADSEHPFSVPVGAAQFDRKTFTDLKFGENVIPIKIANGKHALCIVNKSGEKRPFVYFRGKKDGGADAYTFGNTNQVKSWSFHYSSGPTNGTNPDTVAPYAENDAGSWENPKTYQLIHSGLDGLFSTQSGTNREIKNQGGITNADFDNITNFSDYGTIKSMMK